MENTYWNTSCVDKLQILKYIPNQLKGFLLALQCNAAGFASGNIHTQKTGKSGQVWNFKKIWRAVLKTGLK